ncbi:hypothetical protein ANCCEY_06241 [Ancylostoma ceylanicum]|uniref:Uncharacterized protein n=1 Tax=Ancylostoma ceylanicum TaxID=53326 RepID=A0A0D6LTY5_9BILA|nr:hypothetical protein ANCCEY_06241 [Ancylostoma ceylanicum]
MSDNDSVHSNQSEDLFLNDEDSCDVADVVQAGVQAGQSTETSFPDVAKPSGSGHNAHGDMTLLNHRELSSSSPKSEAAESKMQVRGLPDSANPSTAHDCGSLEQASDSSKECSLRDNVEQSIARLERGNNDGENTFGRYMQLKKDKLRYQVNVLDRPHSITSEIFKGISIFVNGYTGATPCAMSSAWCYE